MGKGCYINLEGVKFNNLQAIKKIGFNKYNYSVWECLCVCGNITHKTSVQLKKQSASCGCKDKGNHTTHGLSNTEEYYVYRTMISRCYNNKSEKYPRYGGRGIKVCERWRISFISFLEDMGNRPSKKHSIERKNNDGNYCPQNCSWQLPIVQARNKSNTKITIEIAREIRGLNLSQQKIADMYNIKKTSVYYIKNNKQWVE